MFANAGPVFGLIGVVVLMLGLYLLGDGLFGFEPDRNPHGPRPLPASDRRPGREPQASSQVWPAGRYLRFYRLLRTGDRE